MRFSLSEESAGQYVSEIRKILEEIQNTNKEMYSGLNDILLKSEYDKLNHVLSSLMDTYEELIRITVKQHLYQEWKDSEYSLLAFMRIYEVGQSAEEVCQTVQDQIEELFVECLHVEKIEAPVLERPVVRESDFEQLREIIRNYRQQMDDDKVRYENELDGLGSDNEIFYSLIWLSNSVCASILEFIPEMERQIAELHEFVIRQGQRQQQMAAENSSEGQNISSSVEIITEGIDGFTDMDSRAGGGGGNSGGGNASGGSPGNESAGNNGVSSEGPGEISARITVSSEGAGSENKRPVAEENLDQGSENPDAVGADRESKHRERLTPGGDKIGNPGPERAGGRVHERSPVAGHISSEEGRQIYPTAAIPSEGAGSETLQNAPKESRHSEYGTDNRQQTVPTTRILQNPETSRSEIIPEEEVSEGRNISAPETLTNAGTISDPAALSDPETISDPAVLSDPETISDPAVSSETETISGAERNSDSGTAPDMNGDYETVPLFDQGAGVQTETDPGLSLNSEPPVSSGRVPEELDPVNQVTSSEATPTHNPGDVSGPAFSQPPASADPAIGQGTDNNMPGNTAVDQRDAEIPADQTIQLTDPQGSITHAATVPGNTSGGNGVPPSSQGPAVSQQSGQPIRQSNISGANPPIVSSGGMVSAGTIAKPTSEEWKKAFQKAANRFIPIKKKGIIGSLPELAESGIEMSALVYRSIKGRSSGNPRRTRVHSAPIRAIGALGDKAGSLVYKMDQNIKAEENAAKAERRQLDSAGKIIMGGYRVYKDLRNQNVDANQLAIARAKAQIGNDVYKMVSFALTRKSPVSAVRAAYDIGNQCVAINQKKCEQLKQRYNVARLEDVEGHLGNLNKMQRFMTRRTVKNGIFVQQMKDYQNQYAVYKREQKIYKDKKKQGISCTEPTKPIPPQGWAKPVNLFNKIKDGISYMNGFKLDGKTELGDYLYNEYKKKKKSSGDTGTNQGSLAAEGTSQT